jgi:hypothetical protein
MKLARHRVLMPHTSGEIAELSTYISEKKNVLLVFTYQGLASKVC